MFGFYKDQNHKKKPTCVCVCLQVRQLQEDAVRLQSAYAGDKADDIQKREGEVSRGGGASALIGSLRACRCCTSRSDVKAIRKGEEGF